MSREELEQRQPDGASGVRTRLSWRRTVLTATVVALLTIRVIVHDGLTDWGSVAIVVTCLGWLTGLWVAQRRIHAMAAREPAVIGRTLPAYAALVIAFALLGIALVAAG